jgi:hypothetical protein
MRIGFGTTGDAATRRRSGLREWHEPAAEHWVAGRRLGRPAATPDGGRRVVGALEKGVPPVP